METWDIEIETRMLHAVVDRAARRGAEVNVLHGLAGSGATTLAEAAVALLRERGVVVLAVYASAELRDAPLGAMAALLSSVETAADAPVAERLQRLFLSLAPASAAPVLFVDDAAQLDNVSAAAVRQLVRSYGVRCILTARTGEALPEQIARLDDEGLVRRTAVDPLSSATAAALVEGAIGSRPEAMSLQRLLVRAGGTPLLLRGLVRAAIASGAVRSTPSGSVIEHVSLPVRLAVAIGAGYDGCGRDAVDFAELLVVAGRLPVAVLDERPGLAELSGAGMVAVVGDSVSIAHPMHAEVLSARLSASRVNELRIEAAELLSRSASDDDRFAGAVALARSSHPPATAEVVWAAQRANALDDRAVAIELGERALRLAADRGEAAPPAASLARADALSVSGRLDEADSAFADALRDATNDQDLSVVAVRAGFHSALRREQPERAAAIWRNALERIVDPTAHAYLTTNIAKWQLRVGALATVDSDTLRQRTPDASTGLDTRLFQLLAAVNAGDVATGRRLLAAIRPLAEATKHVARNVTDTADFVEFVLMIFEARIDEALSFAERVLVDPFAESAGVWSYGTAFAHYQAGRFDEALRLATIAVEQLGWRDFLGLSGSAVGLRASAAAQLGLFDLAAQIAGAMGAEARRVVAGDLQIAEAEAYILAAAGEERAAIERIAASVGAAIAADHGSLAGITASVATRLGHPGVALDAMRLVVGAPTAPVVALLNGYATALDAADPRALLESAEALETAGFAAAAHDAARQAADLARGASQTSLARKAESVRVRVGGLLSPSPLSVGTAGILSERELTIATLAASRERNREIADQLGLSLRTVENHLANVYRKLGVDGRDELRERLG
jgi:DNA-binding CsgD family transcriptional regulator